jgi:predicted Kef-type K+ transport protein
MDIFWIATAFLAGLIAKAVRLPTLVGFLGAGLVLSLFGITSSNLLHELGEIGVILLLFSVGLHLRLKNLIRSEVLAVGGIHLVISTIIFSLVGLATGLDPMVALLIAVALGFSSTVLTAKSLEARNELDTYHGRVAIGILILQDAVAIVLLALIGGKEFTPWAFLLLLLPLLRPVLTRLMVISGHDELALLFGLAMALGFAYLFKLVGLSAELGALVGGLLLAGHEQTKILDERLWSLKEIFLVGFFLDIGLAGFPDLNGIVLVFVLLALLPIKAILFFFLFTRFRLRSRTAFVTTISLTAYSEFALIVSATAFEANLISQNVVVTLALLVAVSFVINAPLSRAANNLWERWESSLVRFERNTEHPDHRPQTVGHSVYLIAGMGRVGTAAYDYICEHGARPMGIDADPNQVQHHLKAGRRVVYGNAQDPELWDDSLLAHVEGVMLALPNLEAKIRAARLLRQHGFTGPINALMRAEENRQLLIDAGVNSVFLPLTEAGRALAQVSLSSIKG